MLFNNSREEQSGQLVAPLLEQSIQEPPPDGYVGYVPYIAQKPHKDKNLLTKVIWWGLVSILSVILVKRAAAVTDASDIEKYGQVPKKQFQIATIGVEKRNLVQLQAADGGSDPSGQIQPPQENGSTEGADKASKNGGSKKLIKPKPKVVKPNKMQKLILATPNAPNILFALAGILSMICVCQIYRKVKLSVQVLKYVGGTRDGNPLDAIEYEAALEDIQYPYESEKGGLAIKTAKAQQEIRDQLQQKWDTLAKTKTEDEKEQARQQNGQENQNKLFAQLDPTDPNANDKEEGKEKEEDEDEEDEKELIEQKKAQQRLKDNIEAQKKNEKEIGAEEDDGQFTLTRNMRVVSSMIVLKMTLLTSYWALTLRLTILTKISQEVSLLLSIMAVFVQSAEMSLDTKIADPSNLIQAGLIFKCLKASLTIIVLTMNGVANDYFVITFFLATSICGLVYLDKAGYSLPQKSTPDEEDSNKVEVLRRQIVTDIISKEEDQAFWRSLVFSMFFFLFSLFVLHNSKAVFGEDNNVSTMGTSAVVMILSNIISWPSILEGIRALPPIKQERVHLIRAQQFLNQLDAVVEFCSQLMNQIKDLAAQAEEANAPEITEEAKDDPNQQHFKYLLQQCDPSNENFLQKLDGGQCEIQGYKRQILVRTLLRPRGVVPEAKRELRFETEDKPPTDYEQISGVDELVVMDTVAFVYQNGREFVFRKGSFFAEHGKDQNREYDAAYNLVAPTSLAPRILLLSTKNVLNAGKVAEKALAQDETEIDVNFEDVQKAEMDKRKIQEAITNAQNLMIQTVNQTYGELSQQWIQRFLQSYRYYILRGERQFLKDFPQDESVKIVLMDYNMAQEQEAIVKKHVEIETGLSFYQKKNQDKGEESIIEQVFPFGYDQLCVKLRARNLIYVFVRERVQTFKHDQPDKSTSVKKNESKHGHKKSEASENMIQFKLLTNDMRHTLFCHVKKLNSNDKNQEQFMQFKSKTLTIFDQADSLMPKLDSYLLQIPPFDWKEVQSDGQERKMSYMNQDRVRNCFFQGQVLERPKGNEIPCQTHIEKSICPNEGCRSEMIKNREQSFIHLCRGCNAWGGNFPNWQMSKYVYHEIEMRRWKQKKSGKDKNWFTCDSCEACDYCEECAYYRVSQNKQFYCGKRKEVMTYYHQVLPPKYKDTDTFTATCTFCSKERELEKKLIEGYYYCQTCDSFKCHKCDSYEELDGMGIIAYMDGSKFEGYFKGGRRDGPGRWIISGLHPLEKAKRGAVFSDDIEKKNQADSEKYQEHHDSILKGCLRPVLSENEASPLYTALNKRIKDPEAMKTLIDEYNNFKLNEQPSENANLKYIRIYQTIDPVQRVHQKYIGKRFIDGAGYFGEWQRKDYDHWVPHGRGVVVNFFKQQVYFGYIEDGQLSGLGTLVPFFKKDDSQSQSDWGFFENDQLVKYTEEKQNEIETQVSSKMKGGLKTLLTHYTAITQQRKKQTQNVKNKQRNEEKKQGDISNKNENKQSSDDKENVIQTAIKYEQTCFQAFEWDKTQQDNVILDVPTTPQKVRTPFGDAIYFGQSNNKGEKHGKGILFIEKEKYIYYGFFANDKKHGFGKEFYDQASILQNYDVGTNARHMIESEFEQWEDLWSIKNFWQGMFKDDERDSLKDVDNSAYEVKVDQWLNAFIEKKCEDKEKKKPDDESQAILADAMRKSPYKILWDKSTGLRIFNKKWLASQDKQFEYYGEYFRKRINEVEHEYAYEAKGRGLLLNLKRNTLYIGGVEQNEKGKYMRQGTGWLIPQGIGAKAKKAIDDWSYEDETLEEPKDFKTMTWLSLCWGGTYDQDRKQEMNQHMKAILKNLNEVCLNKNMGKYIKFKNIEGSNQQQHLDEQTLRRLDEEVFNSSQWDTCTLLVTEKDRIIKGLQKITRDGTSDDVYYFGQWTLRQWNLGQYITKRDGMGLEINKTQGYVYIGQFSDNQINGKGFKIPIGNRYKRACINQDFEEGATLKSDEQKTQLKKDQVEDDNKVFDNIFGDQNNESQMSQLSTAGVEDVWTTIKANYELAKSKLVFKMEMKPEDQDETREIKEMQPSKDDRGMVIAEWIQTGEADTKQWVIDGRCIHFNEGERTCYVGHMIKGKRHGCGLEIPMKDIKYRGQYKKVRFDHGKRVIDDSDTENESREKNSYLTNLLFTVCEENKLLNQQASAPFLQNQYYKEVENQSALLYEDDYGYEDEEDLDVLTVDLKETDLKFNWEYDRYDPSLDREIRECISIKDIPSLTFPSDMTEAIYGGEWNDCITNNNPQMDGRGIREIRTEKTRTIHIGNFKCGEADGFGLQIHIKNYGLPNQEIKCKMGIYQDNNLNANLTEQLDHMEVQKEKKRKEEEISTQIHTGVKRQMTVKPNIQQPSPLQTGEGTGNEANVPQPIADQPPPVLKSPTVETGSDAPKETMNEGPKEAGQVEPNQQDNAADDLDPDDKDKREQPYGDEVDEAEQEQTNNQ